MKNTGNLGKHPLADTEGVEIIEAKGHQIPVVTVTKIGSFMMFGFSDACVKTDRIDSDSEEDIGQKYAITADGYVPLEEYIEALEPTKGFLRANEDDK